MTKKKCPFGRFDDCDERCMLLVSISANGETGKYCAFFASFVFASTSAVRGVGEIMKGFASTSYNQDKSEESSE